MNASNIKTQLVLGVGVTYLLLFSFTYVALHVIILDGAERVELAANDHEMRNIQFNLQRVEQSLSQTCRDLSAAEALRGAVRNGDLRSSLLFTEDAFQIMNVDFILITDGSGDPYFHKADAEAAVIDAEEVAARVRKELASPERSDLRVTGYARVSGQTVLLSANRILGVSEGDPLQGTLVMGRLLGGRFLRELSVRSEIQLRVSEAQGDELQDQGVKLDAEGDSILGSFQLRDFLGGGGASVQVNFPRPLYLDAVRQLNLFVWTFGIILAASAGLAFYMTDRTLLSRIDIIGEDLGKLDPSRKLNHLESHESGELDKIVKSVNMLLDEIDSYKVKLGESERLAAMGQTASMVGHDLRNPLQTITTTSYIINKKLFRSGGLDQTDLEDCRQLLGVIDDQTWYMDKIVSDIQSYAGTVKPLAGPCDIARIATSALDSVKVPTGIRATVEIPPGLPPVLADDALVKRVFINLALNSVQAMPEGGTLAVTAEKAGDKVKVSIHDTGVGIPEGDRGNLFKPFFTTKAKGTGLGLAACKRIVEAQGGEVSVESAVGHGTTISFTLPTEKHPEPGLV